MGGTRNIGTGNIRRFKVQNTNYTTAADIYSVGITTLELFYNRTPFDDWAPLKVSFQQTKLLILQCKLEYQVPKVIADKSMDKYMTDFVQLCIRKDPKDR